METIKDRIRNLCKQRGITARKLEEDLGFGNGYISKLDKSSPNVTKVQQIADYLGVSLSLLMTGAEEEVQGYYYDEHTAEIAQRIYDSKALSLLFGEAANANIDDIMVTYNVLMALKKKERHDD